MTATITSKTIERGSERVHIEISLDKYSNAYKVTEATATGGLDAFRVERENFYHDIKKAKARYNYLIRQANR